MRNNNVKVSVIMPVYNGEKYLVDSINSILEQTLIDFEFIIINDGSNDKSLDIIKSFNDPRIILISNERQYGISKSLNIAIKKAVGKYIARMDADDISLPIRLEEQYTYMEENKDIDICGSWVYKFSSKLSSRNDIWKKPCNDEEIKAIMLFSCPILHPTVFLRRDSILKNKLLYDENYISSQDYELWSRAIDYVKFANIKKPLLFYRIHENSVTGKKSENQKINSEKIRKYLLNKFKLPKEPKNNSIIDTEKWLLTIRDHSKLNKYCSKKVLDNIFDKIWFAKCLERNKDGLSIYKIFLFSKLRKNNIRNIIKSVFLLFKLLRIM